MNHDDDKGYIHVTCNQQQVRWWNMYDNAVIKGVTEHKELILIFLFHDMCSAFPPHKQRVSGAFYKKTVNNQDINDFINHREVTPDEGWGAIARKSYTNPVI
jgi:hypothetical protein